MVQQTLASQDLEKKYPGKMGRSLVLLPNSYITLAK
jgi:hypothetical protein